MREIKFRGYIPQYLGMKGYFVYGLLVRKIDDVCTILSNDKLYAVPCEAIGQFTGLHDKNGVEIYEGDVVKVRKISIDDKLYEAKVLFQQIGRSGFAYSIDYKDDNGTLFYGLQEQNYIEVIGNIHEEVGE